MLRARTVAVFIVAMLVMAAPRARAFTGLGLQGGLYTPTNEARDLLDAQWVLGLRLVLPPYSPIGLLNSRSLHLDLGLDLSLDKAKRVTLENLDTQLLNLTVMYRYSLPVSQSLLLYAGLGGRVSAVWGELSQTLRDGSLFGHLRGAMTACGGVDYVIPPDKMVDLRVSTGILGFTSWEVMLGFLFAQ
jgi:hypothetical protein